MCYVLVAFEPCFSFSATFELAILLASCNALLHWFSTRHGASDLVRNFFFIYIICIVASGYSNASIWRYHFSYRLQGLHFLILFTLRPYLASGLALFFFLFLVWGWRKTLIRFISFPRFVFCGGKNAGFPSNPTFGRVICFFGRWASSLKAQIALMMRKCNLMSV